jgi:uncharacterized protein
MHKTRPLDAIEIRVLGALMEKEVTTPDQYPLTINGVIAACNQKSNRDPVMDLTETQVVEALDRLRLDVLTWRSEGARVERWQHSLDRRWQLTSASKAIMTELMIRGPQTPGELKTRCSRMHHFETKEDVEAVLQRLEGGFDALVRDLGRRPGQRDNRWTHIVAAEGATEAAVELAVEPPAPAAPAAVPPAAPSYAAPAAPPVPSGPSPHQRLDRLEAELAELKEELRSLRVRLGDLE